jgi:hypothetical protein
MKMIADLRQALDQVARRFRQVRLWGGLALCWLVLALVGLVVEATVFRADPTSAQSVLFLVALSTVAAGVGLVWSLVALGSVRDLRWVARRVEAKHPELSALLLAAVEQ